MEKYGNQSAGDNMFTRKARLLQSIYRVECNQTVSGFGPNKNSTSRYGNMLENGAVTGKNFFYKETFEYAKRRVLEKKREETIDEYRLFNNLLSSMPMAFNLFHPLMIMKDQSPEILNTIVKSLFPALPVHHVESILVEFIPTPIADYTNDKSAMDAAIIFSDESGYKHIIAIETKYTDSLGLNIAKDNVSKYEVAIQSGLFTEAGIEVIKNGCTQIYRNFLSVEKYRIVHDFKDSYSIILAPNDHPTTCKEITSLLTCLKPAAHYKIKSYTLENFITIIEEHCPPNYRPWVKWFRNRYLDFSKVASINTEYSK